MPKKSHPVEALPFDRDSNEAVAFTTKSVGNFKYLGWGLTAEGFERYVASYDFGPVPPDFIVLHHTATPGTLHTGAWNNGWLWDANEAGLVQRAILAKRQRQLGQMRDYYRDVLKWSAGPHLFIDERYIWLFTPMYEIGIHAAGGNSRYVAGKLHYSVGIEVIGYYEHKEWPDPIARLVGHAVAVLKRRLQTFEYLQHPFEGGISSHRDYNKPSCPGAAITEDYYMTILRQGWRRLNVGVR